MRSPGGGQRDNRIVYGAILRYAGYEVLEAVNGADGVAQARTHHPDLILMDLSMPVLDGWEATLKIKSDPLTANIPVLAFTAQILSVDERNR